MARLASGGAAASSTRRGLAAAMRAQKSLLGLVQSAPCRIDMEFKDADGKAHKNTTTIKTKKEDTEEVPVYTNKDTISGEVSCGRGGRRCGGHRQDAPGGRPAHASEEQLHATTGGGLRAVHAATLRLTPLTTKKLEHQGIKVQLLGQIELASERGTVHEFVSLGAVLIQWAVCMHGSGRRTHRPQG